MLSISYKGHVIAEINGGELEPENLKPICQSCNSSMGSLLAKANKPALRGTTNMNEFIRKYKLNQVKPRINRINLFENTPNNKTIGKKTKNKIKEMRNLKNIDNRI